MSTLLDVNVLIALLDSDHVEHRRARTWFREAAPGGWATCPITQNGCVRIMSQGAYPNALATAEVIERLGAATRDARHQFWHDDVSILDTRVATRGRVLGPRQVTDTYLLALAVRHGGCFATFDAAVALAAVPGATKKHLRVI